MPNNFQAQRKGENFPVAGLLLPKKQRQSTLAFYDYVRGLDEIADAPSQSARAKEAALQAVEHAPPPWAEPYLAACKQGAIDARHGQQLMQAFLLDCRKSRYQSWQELLDYCQLSAVPVGRFMLANFAEKEPNLQAADALCSLLQIINHLQDIKADFLTLRRIYLPQDLMGQYGVSEEMLAADAMCAPLTALVHDMLQRCDALLQQAQPLPSSVSHWRLRVQLGWVLNITRALMKQLRKRDLLAQRVTLARWRYITALWH